MTILFSNRKTFIFFLWVFILSFILLYTLNAFAQTQPIVCTQQYALCTSAPCIPDPRHPEYAICSCVVEKGDSVGYKSCANRTPKLHKFNTIQVISTFSFKQFNVKKNMTCAKGIPWTNCVDAPCTIDPMHPNKAICSCKINHTEAFFTLGGNCDFKTCAKGFWSGSTFSAGILLRNTLLNKLKITKSSWLNHTCQK